MAIETRDIETALKNLDKFLKISDLKDAVVRKNKNGSLFKYVGGFNAVFQLKLQNKKWALRVGHVSVGENKERFQLISNYLSNVNLSYFADFIYDEKGILINGELHDTIRMEWLEGKLFKEYLEEHLNNTTKLKSLAESFLQMSKDLRNNNISHGDLQHGNILIDENSKIKLIDYDSIAVPDITGLVELTTGLKGYQHPSRFNNKYVSLKSDYFSVLVIYISILALAENKDLWKKYSVESTEYLLFSESDFENFENSQIFNDLSLLSSKIKSLLRVLNIYLNTTDFKDLKPFEEYLTPPKIISFKSSVKKIIVGDLVKLSWNVENSDEIFLSTHKKKDLSQNYLNVRPKENTTYILTAKNSLGIVEKKINIKVFENPLIKEFKASHSKLEYNKELRIEWKAEHFSKLEIHFNGNVKDCTDKDFFIDTPEIDTEYKLVLTALDNKTIIEKKLNVLVFKRVKILDFVSNLNFTIVTLPINFTWLVENSSQIILSSNDGYTVNVTNKNFIELFPNKDTIYYLKASNDLFSDEKQIRITVEQIPALPSFPKWDGLIPSFDINLKFMEDEIIKKSNSDFEKFIENENNKFGFKKFLKKIFSK